MVLKQNLPVHVNVSVQPNVVISKNRNSELLGLLYYEIYSNTQNTPGKQQAIRGQPVGDLLNLKSLGIKV